MKKKRRTRTALSAARKINGLQCFPCTRVSWMICCLLLALVLSGCNGDYGSETGSEEHSSFFVSDPYDPEQEENLVVLRMVRSAANVLTLALDAVSLTTPIYGVASDLSYDAELLEYLDYSEGSFFEGSLENKGLQFCRVERLDNEPGRLVLGATRAGEKTSGLVGSGRILTMRFQGRKTGSCRLELERLMCRQEDLSPVDRMKIVGGQAYCTFGPVESR